MDGGARVTSKSNRYWIDRIRQDEGVFLTGRKDERAAASRSARWEIDRLRQSDAVGSHIPTCTRSGVRGRDAELLDLIRHESLEEGLTR